MNNKLVTALLVFLFSIAAQAYAEDPSSAIAEETTPQLPVPRFVTLDADEVNVRTGPGVRYPIKFIFNKDGLPVEIIKEFDVWRQIRSMDGDEGWAHKSLLSSRRAVIITGHIQTLFKKPDDGTKPVVRLEPGVIAGLDHCDNGWCYLKVAGYGGWIKKENFWGIYPEEQFVK